MNNADKDFATGKRVNFSQPEEKVRQAYERILHEDFGYPKGHMDIKVRIPMGVANKECDIAVYSDAAKKQIIGIVETKAPKKLSDTHIGQLKSYMAATSTCSWGVATDGDKLQFFRKDKKTLDIKEYPASFPPKFGESDQSVIKRYADLVPASNLKFIFRLINKALYVNTNIPRAEKQGAEMVRLVFCKLQDEYNTRGTDKQPQFQVMQDEGAQATRKRINDLWAQTTGSFVGASIFDENEKITIDDYPLQLIISKLQSYSLLQTNRDAVGDAFEIFSEKQFSGDKGQFFTPRAVVKMVVEMVSPTKGDTIIDPACGSGGFLISALDHITQNIASEDEKKRVAEHSIYGIDKDGDLSKICKSHMSIIGDGKSNIVCGDSLKPSEWDAATQAKLLENGQLKQFDVVLTNPPFGSNIKVDDALVLSAFDLGHKWESHKNRLGVEWTQTDVTKPTPPQVLFIEFCLNLLKPNGKLGIVLPDGLLGNPSDGYIRQWVSSQAQILAIIDCPTATFMPHTGTKTSVLVMRKREAAVPAAAAKQKDIFSAIAEHCGHTMRGRDILLPRVGGIKEDFSIIAQNYLQRKRNRHLGFFIKTPKNNILVPRYYDPRIKKAINDMTHSHDFNMESLRDLESRGVLTVSGMPSSVSAEGYDLHGSVRFVRTSDVQYYEVSQHTEKMVDEATYRQYCKKQDLQIGDILFVKDGDHRIGETAILLDDHDRHILVQSHFKKIRPLQIDSLLLLYLLNMPIVKKQIRQRVFNQSTLSTIGDRIGELILPMPATPKQAEGIIEEMERCVKQRRQLLRDLSAIYQP